MSMSFDELVSKAIYICKKHDEISPALFQRTLMTDFHTGFRVFKELVRIGVVSSYREDELDDEGENLIGKVSKQKLKEYLTN